MRWPWTARRSFEDEWDDTPCDDCQMATLPPGRARAEWRTPRLVDRLTGGSL